MERDSFMRATNFWPTVYLCILYFVKNIEKMNWVGNVPVKL